MDYLRTTEAELGIDFDRPLTNNRLKSSVQYKDHSAGTILNEPVLASSALALQVLKRSGSIFTSVYVVVQTLKKDSWKELQFSLVDNSKLNIVYLLNRI
ncbi:hypothetical protein Tco_1423910 [Tanacetum coccineum]